VLMGAMIGFVMTVTALMVSSSQGKG